MDSEKTAGELLSYVNQKTHNNHALRPPRRTPPSPQYAVTTLAHAPPSSPTRPTRPHPRVQLLVAQLPPPAPSPPVGLYSASVGTPWGHFLVMSTLISYQMARALFGIRSAKTDSTNQVLLHRLGACLPSRLDHRLAFGIPSAFTLGHERTNSATTALTSTARPKCQRTELPQMRDNSRRCGETGTCATCCHGQAGVV